ncbi:MAG: DUF47 family protein [Candidatus Hodarchaeota archaeon]
MSSEKEIYGPEFQGILDAIDKSGFLLVALIERSLQSSSQSEIDDLIEDIVMNEKIVDRAREMFVERLYVHKNYLSKFTADDNYFIVRFLDELEDQIEIVARTFAMYRFDFPQEIMTIISGLARKVNEVVQLTLSSVEIFYRDLSLVRQEIDKIEDTRREARELELKVLKVLFESIIKQLNPSLMLMIKSLIEDLTNIANLAEEFGDDLEVLVLKYLYK